MASQAQLLQIAKRNTVANFTRDEARSDETSQNITSMLPIRKIEGAVGSSSASMRAMAKVYIVPSTATAKQRECFFMFLACLYHTSSDKDQMKWNNLLATLIHFLYKDVVTPVINHELQPVQMTVAQLEVISAMVVAVAERPKGSQQTAAPLFKDAGYKKSLFDLPVIAGPAVGSVMWVEEWTAMYAFLGVICFTVNKDITGSGENALRSARFIALSNKYKWSPDKYTFLGGSLSPNEHAFEMTTAAWKRLPVTRRVFFSYAGKIGELSGTAEDEALYTTVRLMKWTDLAHVQIITTFLSQYGWAGSCPALRASITEYNNSISQMVSMCPVLYDTMGRKITRTGGAEARDVALLPFIKAIHGDGLDVARRDRFLPLLYVAHKVLSTDNTTLASYQVPESFQAAYDEFIAVKRMMEAVTAEDEEESDQTE
jgi:hypothetical protein